MYATCRTSAVILQACPTLELPETTPISLLRIETRIAPHLRVLTGLALHQLDERLGVLVESVSASINAATLTLVGLVLLSAIHRAIRLCLRPAPDQGRGRPFHKGPGGNSEGILERSTTAD
jgi:hypothetical protein